jgi:hypothetical protein
MGMRLRRWGGLSWRERGRLLGCAIGLALVHAALAALGFVRTRRIIEAMTRTTATRTANADELADAKSLAAVAAIAGRHGVVEATCLRQSLLLYAWLRQRGLQPRLQLGTSSRVAPFQAHAWIELEGTRLRAADAGPLPFVADAPRKGPA